MDTTSTLTNEQQSTIYWLALEVASAIAEGCRDPHAEDIAGIRSLFPLLRKDQAETLSQLVTIEAAA